MKNITQEMLETLIKKLQSGRQLAAPKTNVAKGLDIPGTPINTPMDTMTQALIGKLQSESPAELAKLTSALTLLSSDVEYGTGRFYDSNGNPELHYWLAAIWAIASLGWPSGKDIARNWSKQGARYTKDGFEKAWNSYKDLSFASESRAGSLDVSSEEISAIVEKAKGAVLTLPLGAVKKSKEGSYVLIGRGAGKKPEEHKVEVGIADDKNIEIISGLTAGDKVLIAVQKYKAGAVKTAVNPLSPMRRR